MALSEPVSDQTSAAEAAAAEACIKPGPTLEQLMSNLSNSGQKASTLLSFDQKPQL